MVETEEEKEGVLCVCAGRGISTRKEARPQDVKQQRKGETRGRRRKKVRSGMNLIRR